MTTRTVFIVALALCAGVSCKKNDSDTPKPGGFLTQGSWVCTALLYRTIPADPWQNGFSFIPACERDDRYTFKTDGTYYSDNGPTKCNSSDPQIAETGKWDINGDELGVDFITGQSALPWSPGICTIIQLDATTLKIEFYSALTYYQATLTHP